MEEKHEHNHENCGCGHEHEHESHKHSHEGCGCGHAHEHESHEHSHEGCGCGHAHEHEVHEHSHEGCGHHHEHEEHREHHRKVTAKSANALTKTYILDGLDCANCAAKIEAKLNTLSGVEDCTITFATKQMRITAVSPNSLIPAIRETIDSMEDGITIIPKNASKESKRGSAASTNRSDSSKQQALHSHDAHPESLDEEMKDLIVILVGAALFLAGIILERTSAPPVAELIVLIAAYLILGGEVLLTAMKNIRKGHLFDENSLMSLATIGAFCIGDYPEAVGVMLFYRIGEYFEERAVETSRKQIMDAIDLRPEVVNLMANGTVREIPAEDAQVGDLLLVRPGDRIPLDGVIVEGVSRIDTSPVTGEPVPVRAAAGDSVISGCVNTSGSLTMRVEKILEESMVTRILDSVENAAAGKPEIDRFITRFSRVYTPAVVFAALFAAFVLPLVIPGWHLVVDPAYTGAASYVKAAEGTASVLTALTFLVISCPCALVLSVPLAFFAGIGSASKKGILFKGGNVIEALARIKAVVMDKTGTITKGNFEVQRTVPADGRRSEEELLALAAGCEINSTHPIAGSIVSAAREKGIALQTPSEVNELAGHGISAKVGENQVLCGNRKLMEMQGIDLTAFSGDEFGTEVLVACDGVYAGCILISDTIKEDAAGAIGKLRKEGIFTAMLTGDSDAGAEHVAKETGIDRVFARLLPEQKLSELKGIRSERGAVMFVGDGINDAPVLAGADVGAAMGSGADAAIEAADVVFLTSEMNAIPTALDIARSTNRISRQNIWFALGVKLLVMVLGVLGFANMWLAVFADTGVSMLCLLNSIRILRK